NVKVRASKKFPVRVLTFLRLRRIPGPLPEKLHRLRPRSFRPSRKGRVRCPLPRRSERGAAGIATKQDAAQPAPCGRVETGGRAAGESCGEGSANAPIGAGAFPSRFEKSGNVRLGPGDQSVVLRMRADPKPKQAPSTSIANARWRSPTRTERYLP